MRWISRRASVEYPFGETDKSSLVSVDGTWYRVSSRQQGVPNPLVAL